MSTGTGPAQASSAQAPSAQAVSAQAVPPEAGPDVTGVRADWVLTMGPAGGDGLGRVDDGIVVVEGDTIVDVVNRKLKASFIRDQPSVWISRSTFSVSSTSSWPPWGETRLQYMLAL